MNMERFGAIGAAVALSLTACGGPEVNPPVDMGIAADGDVEPVTLEEAATHTAKDHEGHFVTDFSCSWEDSKEGMGEWIQDRVEDIKAMDLSLEEELETLSRFWQEETVKHAEAHPDKARNYLKGIDTYLSPVAEGMKQAGEWELETDEDVVTTMADYVTRTSIDTLDEGVDGHNTSCDPETGEVVPTGKIKHIDEATLVITFNAEVINEGTSDEAIVIADRDDPKKTYTAKTGGGLIIANGKVLIAMLLCNNPQFKADFVPTIMTTTPTPTPSETTTTPPPTSGPKAIVRHPAPYADNPTPIETETEEAGGPADHTASDETGHTNRTRPSEQNTVVDDDEDVPNGDVTPRSTTTPAPSSTSSSTPVPRSQDRSTSTVDNDDPGADAAEPQPTPS